MEFQPSPSDDSDNEPYESPETYPRKYSSYDPAQEIYALKLALENGLNTNAVWDQETIMPHIPNLLPNLPPSYEHHDWVYQNTPLHRAFYFSDVEAAAHLVDHGANIDLRNAAGQTALHTAVAQNRPEVVRFLLARGANVDLLTDQVSLQWKDREFITAGHGGLHALHIALLEDNRDFVPTLLEANADTGPQSHGGWTCLDLFLLTQDRSVCKILLQHGSRISEPSATHIDTSDLVVNSRKLLAVVASKLGVVPPAYLLDVYKHAVSKIDWHRIYEERNLDEMLRHFIGDLFDTLRTTAEQDPIEPNPSFCPVCERFQADACSSHDGISSLVAVSWPSLAGLEAAAASTGCDLCGLFATAAQYAGHSADEHAMRIAKIGGQVEQQPGSTLPVEIVIAESDEDGSLMEVRYREQKIDLHIEPFASSFEQVYYETISKRVVGNGVSGESPFHESLPVAKRWLQDCRSSSAHNLCQQSYRSTHDSVLPARLINVSNIKMPYLVDIGVSQRPPFAALSYCWGKPTNTSTTKANLASHQKTLPVQSLPPVLLDAIKTANELGLEYLWVDALCIVQDDGEDWAREAQKMHAIYANADITISSVVSRDCREGFVRQKSLLGTQPVPIKMSIPKRSRPEHGDAENFRLAVYPSYMYDDFKTQGPVHSRGWTLQEQLLSTRILWFGENMLHWECLHGYALEADPSASLKIQWEEQNQISHWITTKRALKGQESSDGAANLHLKRIHQYRIWEMQVEIFTGRNLTKASDRLAAFLAVPNYLKGSLGGEFDGGIWRGGHLLESLCWRLKAPRKDSQATPSWTWTNCKDEISFSHFDRANRGRFLPAATVINVDVQSNVAKGEVSGSIILKGRLYRMKAFGKKQSDMIRAEPDDDERIGDLRRDVPECVPLFDHPDEMMAANRGWFALDVLECLPKDPKDDIYPDIWHCPPALVRLLLQPTDATQLKFRRIGVQMVPHVKGSKTMVCDLCLGAGPSSECEVELV